MSKVEEIAMEHCCAKCVHNKFGCGMKIVSHGRDCIKCGNYIKGYEQSEKDLELTWGDMEKIVDLYDDVYCDFSIDWKGGKTNTKEHYQEVLKRYKDLKHVK